MPLVQTRGAASAQGFGEFAQSGPVNYIEEVFSTYLYVGNGATQTITNGIDLSTKGGLVWIKDRASSSASAPHGLFDTVRGVRKSIYTNTTGAQETAPGSTDDLYAFTTSGFSVGSSYYMSINNNATNYASWTFRKQPKFFDIQTWTGSGANRTISHALGSVPACIIVKRTDTTAAWAVYHRSLANTQYLVLNTTAAVATGATWWNSTTPTSSVFSVGTDATVNASAGTYIAYIFAHDAGGFGLTGTDNVISCGSYTGDGTTDGSYLVSLGYEPQWVLVKRTDSSTNGGWHMIDVMRGMPTATSASSITALLLANTSAAEVLDSTGGPKATGFSPVASLTNTNAATYIYIAIRRGPMKVPTLGTDVYNAIARTGTGATATVSTVGFPPDAALITSRNKVGTPTNNMFDRLRGAKLLVSTDATTAEVTDATTVTGFDLMTGVYLGDGSSGRVNYVYGSTFINWFFKRAPSFFDEACYTGTGGALSVSHNLGAVPELMIVKRRNSATYGDWYVYTAFSGNTKYQALNSTIAATSAGIDVWSLTNPTSTIMSVGSDLSFSASPYVAYLFATCAGVSKVFSYTGNGSSQTINCGFTAGSRFVMIKRTDSTGDWYVWDSARGIVAGDDPHLSLNTSVAEVTTDDSVDTDNTGFIVNQLSATNVNVTSATYIGLAIA